MMIFMATALKAQTAREIAENAMKAVDFASMEMTSTLTIADNKGNIRVRQITNSTRKFGETTKTLIRFISPAEVKGTAMLVYDYNDSPDDMWIFMPALRKTRRIVSSEKGQSFMGSEFSNADMARPNLDDYSYRILGTERLGDKTCWKIESVCASEDIADENGFTRKIAWIDQASNLTYKVEYYDAGNQLFKVMRLDDYKKQSNGRYFSFKMEAENIENGRKSVLTVNQFNAASPLEESSFSITSLGG